MATIIDCAGNVIRHGMPDQVCAWSLSGKSKPGKDVLKVRACPSCTAVYEQCLSRCPYCNFKPEPVSRDTVKGVEGDLTLMTPEVLAEIRREIVRIDAEPNYPFLQGMARAGAHKKHRERQKAQIVLRSEILSWMNNHVHMQAGDSFRLFYERFGTDPLSARTLGFKDALRLTHAIRRMG